MSAYSRGAYEGRRLTDNLACFPQEFSIEKPRRSFSLVQKQDCPLSLSFKTVRKPFRIYDIMLQAEGAQAQHNFVSKE
jgi:hypothetical protein